MAIDYLIENSEDDSTLSGAAAGSADIPTVSDTQSIQQVQSHKHTGAIDYIRLGNILFEEALRSDLEVAITTNIAEVADYHPVPSTGPGHQVTPLAPVISSTVVHVPDTVQETDASTHRPKIVRLKVPQVASNGAVGTKSPLEDQIKTEELKAEESTKTEIKKPTGPKIRWSQEHSDYLRDLSNQPLPWEEIYVLFRERYPTPPHPHRSDHAMQVKLNRWQSAARRASAAAPAGQAWTAVNGDTTGEGQGRGSLSAVRIGSLGGNGGKAARYRTARNIKKVQDTEPDDTSLVPAIERSTSDGSRGELLRAGQLAGEETARSQDAAADGDNEGDDNVGV